MLTHLRHRPTADLVVVFLAAVVGFILVTAVLGVFVVEIVHPEARTDLVLTKVANATNTLIGAVIGYVAGRSTLHRNGDPPPDNPE